MHRSPDSYEPIAKGDLGWILTITVKGRTVMSFLLVSRLREVYNKSQ